MTEIEQLEARIAELERELESEQRMRDEDNAFAGAVVDELIRLTGDWLAGWRITWKLRPELRGAPFTPGGPGGIPLQIGCGASD